MKFLEKICLSIVLIITSSVYSQNMQEGFQYLETGKFDKAEIFFQKILQKKRLNL